MYKRPILHSGCEIANSVQDIASIARNSPLKPWSLQEYTNEVFCTCTHWEARPIGSCNRALYNIEILTRMRYIQAMKASTHEVSYSQVLADSGQGECKNGWSWWINLHNYSGKRSCVILTCLSFSRRKARKSKSRKKKKAASDWSRCHATIATEQQNWKWKD